MLSSTCLNVYFTIFQRTIIYSFTTLDLDSVTQQWSPNLVYGFCDIDLECKKPLYLEEIGTGLPHVYSREQRQLKDKRTLLLKCGIEYYYYYFITMMYNISLAAITAIGKSNGMAEGHSQVINAHLQI